MANQAWTGADAELFVESNSSLPIKGDSSHTLQYYVNTHSPAWGVIVNPLPKVDVLVWYDAANRLHVVEVTGNPAVAEIIKPAYHTADESFLYNLSESMSKGLSVIPSFDNVVKYASYAALAYAVLILWKAKN